MYKRVISMILAAFVLAVIPLGVLALTQEDYTDAGEVTIGTVVIAGEEYSFIYSPALTVNKSLAAGLSEKLGEAGTLFSEIKFDYQVLNRQSFFILCSEDTTPEYLAAQSTLEQSFLEAFDGYSDVEYNPAYFVDAIVQDECVELEGDRSVATVILEVEPEYIEREVNGETYKVLMVGSKKYRYTVSNVSVRLLLSSDDVGSYDEPEVTENTDVTTTAASTTTTTTTTTTTASATTTTTTAVSTTETTTTTTTATTTTTEADVLPTSPPVEIELNEIGYVVTSIKNLRVRESASMEAPVIATLPKSTQVNIIGAVGTEWYKIRLDDDRVGYCYAKYIEVK